MARITVEDCFNVLPNRFLLALVATLVTKRINSGTPIKSNEDSEADFEHSNDKPVVSALRAIAGGNIDIDKVKDDLIESLRKNNIPDQVNDENLHATAADNGRDSLDIIDYDDSNYELDLTEHDLTSDSHELAFEDEPSEEDKYK